MRCSLTLPLKVVASGIALACMIAAPVSAQTGTAAAKPPAATTLTGSLPDRMLEDERLHFDRI